VQSAPALQWPLASQGPPTSPTGALPPLPLPVVALVLPLDSPPLPAPPTPPRSTGFAQAAKRIVVIHESTAARPSHRRSVFITGEVSMSPVGAQPEDKGFARRGSNA
jgi:hypothetical protein